MAVKLRGNERRYYERIWNIVRPLHAIAIELAGEKKQENEKYPRVLHVAYRRRIVPRTMKHWVPQPDPWCNKQVKEFINSLCLREQLAHEQYCSP